ncbi:coagulation factor X-like isoform X2 [Scylla paramamosain]|uniref:coagulation factor X-like isoform X2 n=1 Tax=Scylla paramamosain TaxID=85552 RepID=UPI0030838A7B
MVPTPTRAALFVAAVMVATTPVSRQPQLVFPSELDPPYLPSAVSGTTVRRTKYEAVGSPDVQRAMMKTERAAAGRPERSNSPDVLSGSELNEAHIKNKLSSILRDLGVGTGSLGQELARSGILLQILERVRADGLASQLTNLFIRGTTDGNTPRGEGGDRQEKDYGGDEEEATDDDIDDQECGVQQPEPRILGGEEAWLGAWPWVAAMIHAPSGRAYCGASLINNRFLLTAGHCAAILPQHLVEVWLGSHDLSKREEQGRVVRTVSQIIIHEDFNSRSLKNDLALLQLDHPVHTTITVRPVCLPQKQDYDTQLATGVAEGGGIVAGWGLVKEDGRPSDILLQFIYNTSHPLTEI